MRSAHLIPHILQLCVTATVAATVLLLIVMLAGIVVKVGMTNAIVISVLIPRMTLTAPLVQVADLRLLLLLLLVLLLLLLLSGGCCSRISPCPLERYIRAPGTHLRGDLCVVQDMMIIIAFTTLGSQAKKLRRGECRLWDS